MIRSLGILSLITIPTLLGNRFPQKNRRKAGQSIRETQGIKERGVKGAGFNAGLMSKRGYIR